jgi:hypothetical protein
MFSGVWLLVSTVLGGEDGTSVILVSWGDDFVLILASLSQGCRDRVYYL